LEKRAEQVLPGIEWGRRGEMAQTMSVHMNKFFKIHNKKILNQQIQ
jgi:hypothetical protein